jgi:enamine deaminase RidA (YjgF/YER057c/UK114 family)
VLAVLAEAGLGVRNLVKVTTYLSDRRYRALNSKIREEILGDHVVEINLGRGNWSEGQGETGQSRDVQVATRSGLVMDPG